MMIIIVTTVTTTTTTTTTATAIFILELIDCILGTGRLVLAYNY